MLTGNLHPYWHLHIASRSPSATLLTLRRSDDLILELFLNTFYIEFGITFAHQLHIRHRGVLLSLKYGVDLLEGAALCLDPVVCLFLRQLDNQTKT